MATAIQEESTLRHQHFTRRRFFHRLSTATMASGFFCVSDLLADKADELRKTGKHLVVLWMDGGPSQFETFDTKSGDVGGGTRSIETSISGIQIASGWNSTATAMKDISLIRSMTNKEGSHPRATYQLHTSYLPTGSLKHPIIGSSIAKEIANQESDLPAVVQIGRSQGVGAAFLGVNYEPFVVDQAGRLPQNTTVPVTAERFQERLGVLGQLESEFARRGNRVVIENHRQLYSKTARMVLSSNLKAFQIDHESATLKEQYGDSEFGRGCMLARRLVEAGVTYVEVTARGPGGNWDTHQDNAERTSQMSAIVDPGFGTLVTDLKTRGLLEDTVVLCIGEFGRTPKINPRAGRDHFPRVFSAAVAGGGVIGGQVIGASTADGSDVAHTPVTPSDLLSSILKALQVDPTKENMSPFGRPMKIVDGGVSVRRLFKNQG